MLFNKNIILEILQSDFGNQVEAMIENCVMDMEASELELLMGYSVDYALLDGIEEIYVTEYEVESEHGEQNVSGVLDIKAMISGYTHWDGEEMHVEDGVVNLVIGFYFETDGNQHTNLQLEQLY